jgi:hypothetical protein
MDTGEIPPDMDPGMENPDFEAPPEEFGDPADTGEFNPPGSSPIPDFLPPAQSFPRSNFTPGLPGSSSRRAPSGAAQPQEQNPAGPPPATFPFTDPFGRPIPIPPGMNEQQQQQQQQQGQTRRQQQQ